MHNVRHIRATKTQIKQIESRLMTFIVMRCVLTSVFVMYLLVSLPTFLLMMCLTSSLSDLFNTLRTYTYPLDSSHCESNLDSTINVCVHDTQDMLKLIVNNQTHFVLIKIN